MNILDDLIIVLLFFLQFFHGYFLIFLHLNLIESFLINLLHVYHPSLSRFRGLQAIIDADHSPLFDSTLLAWFLVLTETILDLDLAANQLVLFFLLLLDTIVLNQYVHFSLEYVSHHSKEYYYPSRRVKLKSKRMSNGRIRGLSLRRVLVLWLEDKWIIE